MFLLCFNLSFLNTIHLARTFTGIGTVLTSATCFSLVPGDSYINSSTEYELSMQISSFFFFWLIGLFGLIALILYTASFFELRKVVTWHFIFLSSLFILIMFKLVTTSMVFLGDVPSMRWLSTGIINIDWNFMVDRLSLIMGFMVMFVSCSVILYAVSYMLDDPELNRFLSLLYLFVFFMLLMVFSGNLLFFFVGWEGIGICSFLLISFWRGRVVAQRSGMKALCINRIGDIAFLTGIGLVLFLCGSLDFAILYTWLQSGMYAYMNTYVYFFQWVFVSQFVFFIACSFLVGVIAKSAQLGLHMWLPDAMEGPTPVSALIHAATMVTAGVFLMERLSALFALQIELSAFIAILGGLTSIVASTIGFVQFDIKKIIAYSTCAQLGLMVMSCGILAFIPAFFHLITHAFYKALLFLCSGSVIHALGDEQDIRKFGGLARLLPFTYSALLVGSFALMGFPYMAGYFSKELIVASVYSYEYQNSISIYLSFLVTFSVLLTAVYSARILSAFWGKPHGYKAVYLHVKESSFALLFPLTGLIFLSIFGGYLLSEVFGYGSSFFGTIYGLDSTSVFVEFIPSWFKAIPLCCSIFGFIFFSYLFVNLPNVPMNNELFWFFVNRWYIDTLVNRFFVKPFFTTGFTVMEIADKGFLEIFGPRGFSVISSYISKIINFLHDSKLWLIFLYSIILYLVVVLYVYLNFFY